jgi:Aerotolerance regulator N-terminal
MGFLAPLMLALAAAAAVPILLHLLQRQHGPRIVFPALRYLRRAERERARRIRLRQFLLLALRVAIVFLIAGAAAQPFLRFGGGTHPPTDVVLVLDNSLSTAAVAGARRTIDVLRSRALETLAAAAPGDRFWLIRAADPWEAAFGGQAAAVADRIRATEPEPAAADLVAEVGRAQSLLAAARGERPGEIQLISDLQATSLPAASVASGGAPVVVWAPSDPAPPNAGVAAVTLDGGFAPRAGEGSTVTAHVAGTSAPAAAGGGPARGSVAVRLFVDDRPVAAAVAPLNSDVTLALPPHAAGTLTGWVEIDADALRGDDRRYFVASIRPPSAVAVSDSVPFLGDAIAVLASAGRIREAQPNGAEVIIAPAAEGADAIRSGAAIVVLPPTSAIELPAVNGRLATAGIPWRFQAPRQNGEARLAAVAGDAELAAALAGTRIVRTYPLAPAAAPGPSPGATAQADSVLMRLSTGEPWVVRGHVAGGGTYLLVSSPLADPTATTLPTSAGIIPLLDRLLSSWAVRGTPVRDVQAGAEITVPASATSLQRPDGSHLAVDGRARLHPVQVGIYRVLAGDSIADAFAVGTAPAESRLDRLPAARLADRFPGHALTLARDSAAWARTIFRQRSGYHVWPAILAAALLVLLVEMLAAAGGRRAARNRAESMTDLLAQS